MALLKNKYSFRLISNKKLKEKVFTISTEPTEDKANDSDKRSFLKILGVAGVGLAASQLIPQKAEALIMGGTPSTSVLGVRNASNTRVNPATEETLTTLATEATLQDVATEATLATRASESTLSAVKTNTDKFIFDNDGNLLTASTASGNTSTKIKDISGEVINPSSEESIIHLRRMVKLMESQAVVDNQMRQKIAVEVMPTVTVSGTVTSNIGTGALSSVTSLNQLAGVDSRWQIVDWSRQAYNSGIRGNLTNS